MKSPLYLQRFRGQTVAIASGPEKYQRRQHEFLDGLRGVINIADDIWVYV